MPVTVSSARLRRRSGGRLRRRSGGRRLAKCSHQRAKASATKRFSRRRRTRAAAVAKRVSRRRGRGRGRGRTSLVAVKRMGRLSLRRRKGAKRRGGNFFKVLFGFEEEETSIAGIPNTTRISCRDNNKLIIDNDNSKMFTCGEFSCYQLSELRRLAILNIKTNNLVIRHNTPRKVHKSSFCQHSILSEAKIKRMN